MLKLYYCWSIINSLDIFEDFQEIINTKEFFIGRDTYDNTCSSVCVGTDFID